jgi:hypothetical protein
VAVKFVLGWNISRQFRVSELYARAATHLGRSRTTRKRLPLATAERSEFRHHSTDDLCDRLLAHMLECDSCLNPECNCSVSEGLSAQIAREGGAAGPAVYSI